MAQVRVAIMCGGVEGGVEGRRDSSLGTSSVWKRSKCRKHSVRCSTPQALLSQIQPTTSLIASCLARPGHAKEEDLQQTDSA